MLRSALRNLAHPVRLTTLSPRLVTVPPRDQVETRAAEEVSASDVGLDPGAVDRIWESVLTMYDTGLYPAVSMCLRYRGAVLIDRAVGHARGMAPDDPPDAEKAPAEPSTLFNLFSAAKSLTAMLIHLLDDRGVLHVDDRVAEYIPEFAGKGKEWITIRHVLTHRSGMPVLPTEHVDLDLLSDPKAILQLLCEAEPLSRPGRRLAYHALTGGFVLGEIVRRVTGMGIDELHRREVLEPLGFEGLSFGIGDEDLPRVAVHAATGFPARKPYSKFLERSLGVSIGEAIRLSNDPRYIKGVIPAGNVLATANEACRYFELLRCEGELDGVRIFSPRTVRRATGEQSYLELDATLMLPVRYGLGFMLGGKRFSFFGADSARAFGHLGFTNVLVWADPGRELSCCLMNSGKPFITPRAIRWFQVAYAVAREIPRRGA